MTVDIDQIKEIVPQSLKVAVTQPLVDKINDICNDVEFAELFRENLIGYSHVLKEGKFSVESYVEASQYVSYKIMGNTNKDAYKKTFPSRYSLLVQAGKSEKEISAYVAGYSKGKLVMSLLEQTMIPFHVYNQDIRQQALGKLVHLMTGARSEKVQQDAASSILAHLKPPEAIPQFNMGETTGVLADLYKATHELVLAQSEALRNGTLSARQVAESKIIDGEIVDG
jgi:hypothetical protein